MISYILTFFAGWFLSKLSGLDWSSDPEPLNLEKAKALQNVRDKQNLEELIKKNGNLKKSISDLKDLNTIAQKHLENEKEVLFAHVIMHGSFFSYLNGIREHWDEFRDRVFKDYNKNPIAHDELYKIFNRSNVKYFLVDLMTSRYVIDKFYELMKLEFKKLDIEKREERIIKIEASQRIINGKLVEDITKEMDN